MLIGENGIIDCSDDGCVEGISGLSNLYCPEDDSPAHIRDIADILSETGKITSDELFQV